jgi:hypothetical protein
MSNPTSNFGWQMPTPTDLVTDLPADFEVFGQAVDSDFVDLLGGTTGQVLSKTSATDLDFTWVSPTAGDIEGVTAGVGISGGGTSGTVTVTNDMATTITAAGDIVVGTGSGTYDNLPIGTTNQVLTADTTVSPYKVKWATPAAGGGMTLLSTTATTSGGTVTISSIDQSYKHLLVIGTGLTGTNNTDYSMRFNGDSGTNYAAFNISYVSTTLSGAFANSTQISISALGTSTSNANTANFSLNIYRYSEGSEFKNVTFFARSKSSVDVGRSGTIAYGSNTAISSISFTTDAGTFATGNIYVYGVK